jgi:uncharacterized protein
MFLNINSFQSVSFSSCKDCVEHCCSGNKFSIAPMVLDDFEKCFSSFPILFTFVDNEFKIVIILNDGKSSCYYLDENNMCSIYNSRPPACKIYPLSPYNDQVFVDTSCKAVGVVGEVLVSKNTITNNFFDDRFIDFPTKLAKTKEFLKQIDKDDLEYVNIIHDIKLYKYNGNLSNIYIDYHKQSLKNLNLIFST